MSKLVKVLTDPSFIRSAKKLMAEDEIAAFKKFISHRPLLGSNAQHLQRREPGLREVLQLPVQGRSVEASEIGVSVQRN